MFCHHCLDLRYYISVVVFQRYWKTLKYSMRLLFKYNGKSPEICALTGGIVHQVVVSWLQMAAKQPQNHLLTAHAAGWRRK